MIQIYDSASKQKQPLTPVTPGKIRMYVCGITVYDYCHIGHARASVLFDVVVRYLRYRGYEVEYVHNITDVEDKIIKRANENGESCEALTERFIDAMHEDERALGVLPPTHEPRATQYIAEIIDLVKTLVAKEYAYVAENGDVYFDVNRFKDYGKLSHRDIEKLIAGARVGISEAKRNPLDFVLWKMSKPDEPNWDSPWGKGRPGWHIECSAMSTELLGQPFDIHGGGMDLKFPHHENEIAQSEAATDKPFANIWMHVGLLQINKEKMSKSLGNFQLIRDVLKEYDAEVVRYFMISGHYRSPVNYAQDNMTKMQHSLQSLYTAVRGLQDTQTPEDSDYEKRFQAAMDDDFNTPEALAVLFELAHEINRLREQNDLTQALPLAAILKKLTSIFGLLQQDPDVYLQGDMAKEQVAQIEALIEARQQARAEKNWAEADRVREQLSALGVVIEDTSQGTSWRRA